jgi:membrane-associated phospholipid phosphatase
MLRFFLCLALLLPISAQANLLDDFASPLTTDARIPLIIGTGLTVGLVVMRDQISNPLGRKLSENKPLGGVAHWGDYAGRMIPNGLYFAGMLAAGLLGNERGLENSEVMALASLSSSFWARGFKAFVREHRPDGSNQQSFPSGHTTSAFAFAATVQKRHGWAWGTPAYALATLTGFSRMNDGKHFLHDVVAGATLGIVYGTGISILREQNHDASSFSLTPVFTREEKSFTLGYRF